MPVKSYDDLLLKSLQDPDEAAEYLTACYADSIPVFLQGLRIVIQARVEGTEQQNKTNLKGENLSQILSDDGNIQLSSLSVILEQLGLSLSFSSNS
ncbi:MAG: transcriptional regulator [Cyanobacteria bacterium P01_F01_bin.143]